MKFTQTVLKTKDTGNFRLAAVERTYENGRKSYGFGHAKRGGKFVIGFHGHSKDQVLRFVRYHIADTINPNILGYHA